MSNELAESTITSIENVLVNGDLSGLSQKQRIEYYGKLCQSLSLNPLSKPFDYLRLNGKVILYAKKDATDQLRKNNKVSITKLERETVSDVYTVTAYAVDDTGRQDSSLGAVSIKGLAGDNLANAMMKAETKAKRRVTLSICGLGMLDETEVETIHDAELVHISEIPEEQKPVLVSFSDVAEMTNSKGEKYRDLDTATLANMHRVMSKKLTEGKYTAEESDEMTRKIKACDMIIKSRSGSQSA